LTDNIKSSLDVNTRNTADTVENLGGRENVIVVALAASLIKGISKDSSAFKSITVSSVLRIAVGITAASTLALFSGTRLKTFAVALARGIALGADVSAHDAVIVGNSSSGNVVNDLVDLLTEAELLSEGKTILLGVSLLITHTSNDKRNILLTGVDGVLLKFAIAGLAKGIRRLSVDTEELLHGELLNISITILARLSGVGGELPGISKELVKGDGGRVLLIHGTDPATRPAGSDEGAEGVIEPAGISRVISRSRGGNVHIVRDVLLVEHRARVASLDEDNPVLVILLGAKQIKESLHITSTGETTAIGHSNDIGVAVVIIVEENVILRSGLKSLAAAARGGHASKNSDEVISGGILAGVILRNILVNIDVVTTLDVEVVVDFTREGIARRVSNIISHENNDTLIRNAELVGDLVSMTDGSLMSVVRIAGRTSSKNNPSVLGIGGRILVSKSTLKKSRIVICSTKSCKSNKSKQSNSLHL